MANSSTNAGATHARKSAVALLTYFFFFGYLRSHMHLRTQTRTEWFRSSVASSLLFFFFRRLINNCGLLKKKKRQISSFRLDYAMKWLKSPFAFFFFFEAALILLLRKRSLKEVLFFFVLHLLQSQSSTGCFLVPISLFFLCTLYGIATDRHLCVGIREFYASRLGFAAVATYGRRGEGNPTTCERKQV